MAREPYRGTCMTFRLLKLPALALGTLLLLGCDRPAASSSATSQPAQGTDEVRLGYFANVTHAQAVLGVHNGDYATAIGPAKLSTKVFNAGPP